MAAAGNNAGAEKLDSFLRQEINCDARLQVDGSVEGPSLVLLA